MITLKNISKQYYHRGKSLIALDNINLSIQKGEVFGIIGRSGAGKSTLIRCINLLEKPDNGAVIVGQQNLTELSPQELRQTRKEIGMIFQHFNLVNNCTVKQNIALPLKLAGNSSREIEQTVLPLLEFVDLKEKQHHYPAQLSGGQKQRVAIARALVTNPKVLLCDEATSSLDPETTLTILNLLKKINRQYQISIVLITHEMAVIKEISDRVAVMHQGRIIEENSVTSLFTKPKNQVTKNFVNSTLAQTLPHEITEQITTTPSTNSATIFRLLFHHNSDEPIVSTLVSRFHLTVSIVQGSVEVIRQETIGILFLAVQGETHDIEQARHYVQQKDIEIEVLGYVERHR